MKPEVLDDARRYAPAALRNRDVIADVLAEHLPSEGDVLEIASGTGEHAIHLAGRFPGLTFHPSDRDSEARTSVRAWIDATKPPNVRAPLALDAAAADWPEGPFAAVLCINMIHIAPWTATLGLLAGAAMVLSPDGFLYLYGPFRRGGVHTAPSNADFDQSLRARDPSWGVRDLEEVLDLASEHGLLLSEVVEMPVNNLSVILRRTLAPALRRSGVGKAPGPGRG